MTFQTSLAAAALLAASFITTGAEASCSDDYLSCVEFRDRLETSCKLRCTSSDCEDRCEARADRQRDACAETQRICLQSEADRPDPLGDLEQRSRETPPIRRFGEDDNSGWREWNRLLGR